MPEFVKQERVNVAAILTIVMDDMDDSSYYDEMPEWCCDIVRRALLAAEQLAEEADQPGGWRPRLTGEEVLQIWGRDRTKS